MSSMSKSKFKKSGTGFNNSSSVLVSTSKRRPKSSVKGILKHPYEQESLATKSGIMRKDGSRLHREGLGMNPNMGFEDEYIENLLKQIHFMNMECKLLKEKQKEGKGYLGIRGMIERDKNILPQHINASIQKQEQMRKLMCQKVLEKQRAIQDLWQKNSQLAAQRNHRKNKLKQTGENYTVIFRKLQDELKKGEADYRKAKRNRESVQSNLQRVKSELIQATKQYDVLDKEIQFLDLNLGKEKKAHNEALNEIDKEIDDQLAVITKQKLKITDLTLEIESNPTIKKLNNKNKDLFKKFLQKREDVFNQNYRGKQLDKLMEMALETKEEMRIEFKRLKAEKDNLEEILKQSESQNEKKVQRRIRSNESIPLKQKQGELAKKQNQLSELEKKLRRLQERLKKFQIERIQMNFVASRLDDKLDKDGRENADHKKELVDNEKEIITNQAAVDGHRHQIVKHSEEIEKHGDLQDELEVQNINLIAELEQRKKHMDINKDLMRINPDALSSLINNNRSTNDTIEDFLQKFQNIKKFTLQLK